MAIIKSETKGENRHYWREDQPDVRHPSVTKIVDMLPKAFLPRWNANMAADLALDSIDYLQRMADRDRAGAKRYIAGAAKRYTKQRSDIGTAAHKLFERMARGLPVGRVHPDMVPYQRHFAEFLDVVQPELVRAEDVAWSDSLRYAGSFDGWLKLRVSGADDKWELDFEGGRGVHVIADWKTSKSVWPSVAIQMSAYANADLIIDAEGVESPMPEFDGAVVLHITPEGWTLYPVYADELRAAFEVFKHLRNVYDWETAGAKRALGKPLARSGEFITGTERRG
ncbi:hypothetical protein ABZ192_12640 [Streptomyces sp. NPDC006235]|uniref:hypothetical protein n=1 Tax=Streptomyces sp. NPDC006235 TaxID=3156736 RepID=UPI0033BD757E